ncbi:MAG: hypothetical protein FWD68_16365 [Alphaproteobacteria bacterium]|nr:hypothetical protein [Alphaproteobacteria bacterium]
MADVRTEDEGIPGGSARGRRAPPTIELEATEVASKAVFEPDRRPPAADLPEDDPPADTVDAGAISSPDSAAPISPSKQISPWVIAPFSGAAAAALVLGVGWMLGWPAPKAPPPASAVVELRERLGRVEAEVASLAQHRIAESDNGASKSAGAKTAGDGTSAATPDPATVARLEQLEKSLDELRGALAGLRQQTSEPSGGEAREDGAAALTRRVEVLAQALEAQRGEVAQLARNLTESGARSGRHGGGDTGLRRVVATALLDIAVRHGDPFVTRLAAVRAIMGDNGELKPLEAFATSGIPSSDVLCRELVEIVPKLAPANVEGTGTGIVDRLQAGASKLVHVEHTGVTEGSDRGAIVSRVTHAALHNHLKIARTELKSLSEADRAPAQGWLDRADAREAALVASRKVADDAMAELAKTAQ